MTRKFFILLICSFVLNGIISCKKYIVIPNADCPLSTDGLRGKYKVSKIKVVLSGSIERDVTDNFDACALDDTMQLLTGSAFHNIDVGTAVSCNNDYYGTWNLSDSNILSIDNVQYPIVGVDCKEIVLTKDSSGFRFKFYYDRF